MTMTQGIIEWFYLFGCDLNTLPTQKYEAFVLGLKFVAVAGFSYFFLKYLFKFMCSMIKG